MTSKILCSVLLVVMFLPAASCAPGKPFDFAKFSDAQKAELGLSVKEGYDAIDERRNNIGKNINPG